MTEVAQTQEQLCAWFSSTQFLLSVLEAASLSILIVCIFLFFSDIACFNIRQFEVER